MRFFIDEDLSPVLVRDCHQAGYDATCCRDRGMLGATDREVAQLCMDEDRVLVTNNADDFLELAEDEGLHPGLIVMPLAARSQEQAWMATAIESIEQRAEEEGKEPPALMINHVSEIDDDGACRHYDYP
jgi:predicted nuclease of predicted toxin-antitoxin system